MPAMPARKKISYRSTFLIIADSAEPSRKPPLANSNAQIADAAIGFFEASRQTTPRAVIELKSPTVNVDRDKFNGRTPVQQCRDYLAEVPECPWGIVSNIVSFRLYHRDHPPRVYELFTLQGLRNRDVFRQFYALFERGGLLPLGLGQIALFQEDHPPGPEAENLQPAAGRLAGQGEGPDATDAGNGKTYRRQGRVRASV